jgi:dTDP-4-amino-4,6-dideoxygalactose transaminase
MYYLVLPSLQARQRLIAHLMSADILSVFHYVPLHASKMGREYGGKPGDCPVAEDLSERLLRLPFHTSLDEATQERVVGSVVRFSGF